MEVHNKEMYHYHRGRYYNDIWQVGKEIKDGELVAFDSIIEKCLNDGF